MGQHKTNPIAIAAKNGEIAPKKKVSKKERDAIVYQKMKEALHKHGLLTAEDLLGYHGPY